MNSFVKNNSALLSIQKGFSYNPNNLTFIFDTLVSNPTINPRTITLPLSGLSPNVSINWGDGVVENYNTIGWKNHTYDNHGTYVVQISGSLRRSWQKEPGYPYASNDPANRLLKCLSWGNVGLNNISEMFYACSFFNEVPSALPTTLTGQTLNGTFGFCTNFNSPAVKTWNISAITNLGNTFRDCPNFNQDLSGWNTGNVTSMLSTFLNCSSFTSNLSNWNTSKVTTMQNMFFNCDAFNTNFANWNIRALTALGLANFMQNATGLSTSNYDSTLIAWNNASPPYRTDLRPHFGGSKYSSAAASARASLVAAGWQITDGGLAP